MIAEYDPWQGHRIRAFCFPASLFDVDVPCRGAIGVICSARSLQPIDCPDWPSGMLPLQVSVTIGYRDVVTPYGVLRKETR